MMSDAKILFNKTRAYAQLPYYAHEDDAGFDILACLHEEGRVIIAPGTTAKIPTGLASEIPTGWLVSVRPRSGLAAKNHLTIQNTPGTIDSGYRGEWFILLRNEGDNPFVVTHGTRIAQGLLERSHKASIEWSSELSKTTRGIGGFGSTGL
jgi:dUTP pyrophosphatase